jgi:manganese/zinc/iron transport system substrate-binding protein
MVARRGLLVMAVGVVMLALLGCKENAAPAPAAAGAEGAKLKVVATTGMIADVARNIAGERAEVTALMGEGVDPHLYKASPGDVRLMADADVILYNGLHLEGRMVDVIVKMKQTVVRVTEGIEESRLREPPEFAGHFDPHVWFDVMLWAAGRGVYEGNAERYLGELRALDA